jgi:putative transposase
VKAVQAELASEGAHVSVARLCAWFGLPRRSFYYQPTPRRQPLDAERVGAIQALIERFPAYGYRRIAAVLGMNRKPVQRVLQRRGWQVRKRPQGYRPRATGKPSVTTGPNQRWATDLAHVWCGRDRRDPGAGHRLRQSRALGLAPGASG